MAIDIGGTKFEAALVGADGELRSRARRATPQTEDPRQLWGALLDVANEALAEGAPRPRGGRPAAGLVAVGVGCGGPMDAGGATVSPLNIPGWRAFPLAGDLANWFGGPCFVDNDAKALTLAEGWVGAARGQANYLGLVVSTGIGGGIVLEGRLIDGAFGNAGHLGHVIVEPDGRRCLCGGRGCLEGEVSGSALQRNYGMVAAEAPPWLRARTGRLVGRGIASVANLLDLRLAVAAGSVALGFGDVFFAAAQAELDDRCRLSFSSGCRIVPAQRGDEAPLLGAAAVAWRGLGRDVLAQRRSD